MICTILSLDGDRDRQSNYLAKEAKDLTAANPLITAGRSPIVFTQPDRVTLTYRLCEGA